MLPILVEDLVKATNGTLISGSLEGEVSSISTDSRKIEPNCLFIPLVGEKFDGHDYVDSSLNAGAAGVVCSHLPAQFLPGKFYIQVEDTRLALKAIASFYRDRFSIPFVQITGSVGKTTTKDMIAAVLQARYQVRKTQGNFNNDIGTPMTLLSLDGSEEAAVVETGMNHFREIAYLGEMVKPQIAVISNVGDAHIEYLGSREGILKAKSEIFENLTDNGVAVLNGDDALLNTVELPGKKIVRCGQSEKCDVKITQILDQGIDGIDCCIETAKDTYHLHIPAPGEHMAYAAALAVGVAEELDLSRDEIERGASSFIPSGARMQILRFSNGTTLLNDCYNANPQSVKAALEILAKTNSDRKVAVLGDMGELGDLTAQAHYNVGALAAMLGIDLVIAIGPKARDIAEGTSFGGGEVFHFDSNEEAMERIEGEMMEGTTILVKASHSMHFEEIVEGLKKKYD